MTESFSDLLVSVLHFAPLDRIRRNHGLEHATLHVLSERFPRQPFAGHSNLNGFWIVGDLSTEDLRAAVLEALQRLQRGEAHWAVHPNCGTNYVTSGVLAGGAAALAMLGGKQRLQDRLERIPLAMLLATLALIIAQPLGLLLQAQVTTSGRADHMQVLEITPAPGRRTTAHRIVTVN